MRINLITPFAEKDAVKALGARWDGTKKVWYVVDKTDLTPFLKWLPTDDAKIEDIKGKPIFAPQQNQIEKVAVQTATLIDISHCGCEVNPWDDCIHTIVS